MLSKPDRPEIDHHTLKLLVGVMAISLAGLTRAFAGKPLESLSASYHVGGVCQCIFVGFLFAIAAFLFAYNGHGQRFQRGQMILSKVAGVAGMGIALFPCGCDGRKETVPYVHYVCAAIMFAILVFFCYVFRLNAMEKPGRKREDERRAKVYACCGVAIATAMLALAINQSFGEILTKWLSTFVFWGEAVALVAFGIAWLTASHVLPYVVAPEERFSPLK